MIKRRGFILILIIACFWAIHPTFAQITSQPFEFQFEGKTLRGLIEIPAEQEPTAVVVLIPGSGRTDFVEGGWFSNLRRRLVSFGLAVCLWDKMGCGGSDGEFDVLQPVENSAEEALAAIQHLKSLNIPGSETVGLWGLSRAGWICPMINKQFPVDFWISVSGTDDKENYGYLLRSNLLIAGKSEEEADRLYESWMLGHRYICTQASYEDYLSAIEPVLQDSTCLELFGYTPVQEITPEGRKDYQEQQQTYTSKGYFDNESGLWVYLDNFAGTLRQLKCPVLALFGANDSQVDWRKTKQLYEQAIGENPAANLTTKVFENCNHTLQKCTTCAYREDLSALQWQACDGYYDTMEEWLRSHQFIK